MAPSEYLLHRQVRALGDFSGSRILWWNPSRLCCGLTGDLARYSQISEIISPHRKGFDGRLCLESVLQLRTPCSLPIDALMAEDPYTGPHLVRGKRRYQPRHLADDFHRDWSYWFGFTWSQLKLRLTVIPSGAAFAAGLLVGHEIFS